MGHVAHEAEVINAYRVMVCVIPLLKSLKQIPELSVCFFERHFITCLRSCGGRCDSIRDC